VKEYAEQGYTQVVVIDLSKYFDTLSHELLMNLLRRQIHDRRVTNIIKKYLKSGVMENGVVRKTEEGSPQGGPLSPLLANIYLNEFDQEMKRRGVQVIRYADDIVVLAKSQRAAGHLLKSSRKYLEGKLKLQVNVQKSKATGVYSKQFKFLGFTLGKNGNGIYIRAHEKSLAKAKRKLKDLTRRNQGRNVRKVMENVKVYISGETPDWVTGESPGAQSYSVPLQMKSSHWRDIMTSRLSMSIFTNCTYAIEPPCTERYARWRERSAAQLMGSLLLDLPKTNKRALIFLLSLRPLWIPPYIKDGRDCLP
jgi:group II intron reverse transcriptase/maturase